jgi:pyruvate-ferredoxin/flavodoxin oxidoreductase
MGNRVTMDGNTAAAHVAYRVNEICAIYPITPASTMAELADAWASQGITNIWGRIPIVQEMQSEGGAAGVLHGALQSGALTTTFTASQGLLLMIPDMFKIAGELTATVFHVAARALATSALSIFGDHSDVMAVRGTGFAMLSSGSVQEAHDTALIAQAATLESRIPFLHFFDGFRTSHELNTLDLLSDQQIRAMIRDDLVREHRARALNPEHPFIRGTAHNPDTFFQAREASNAFYQRVPAIVQAAMDRFGRLSGRPYRLFEYEGAPDAERIIVLMGSGAETARSTVRALCAAGEKVGVLQVRLYRPFSSADFLAAIPSTARSVAVLDRTKEPGSTGEPLYLDVVATLAQGIARGERSHMPRVIGGRYGIGSKDFTPAMVKATLDEMSKPEPKNSFTVGISDDVSHRSLEIDPHFAIETDKVTRCVFYGLGADGTVGANKNSVKIIAQDVGLYAQGYFVYDSHKSGAQTISHLRFGPEPIHAPYLIASASFVACHQHGFLARGDVLRVAADRAVGAAECALFGRRNLGPSAATGAADVHRQEIALVRHRRLRRCARGRAGFADQHDSADLLLRHSGVLPREKAIGYIKESIRKTYTRGRVNRLCDKNFAAVDGDAWSRLSEVACSGERHEHGPLCWQSAPANAPHFVRDGDRADLRWTGRRDSRQRHTGRRHVSVGHKRVRKAQPLRHVPVWRDLTFAFSADNAVSSVRTASSGRATITKIAWTERRTDSSRRRSTPAAIPGVPASRCSSMSKTARAVGFASRRAPLSIRVTADAKARSIWPTKRR